MAHTYQEYFKETEQNLYGTKPVVIPKPELYVIFTKDTGIDKKVITLSEEFFGGEESALDVKVNIITAENSNGIIEQYITFTRVLDAQVKKYGYTRKAIVETIGICKTEDILKEFLEEHEKEVVNIMISLYSQEEIYEMFLRDLKKESIAEGKEDVAIEMIKENEEPSKISRFTHLSLERISELKAMLSNNVQLANE